MKKLILPILIILLLPLIYQSTPTEILKLKVFDSFIQIPNESGNFVILNITEEDVEREGGYPLPRKRLAEIQMEMLGKGALGMALKGSGVGAGLGLALDAYTLYQLAGIVSEATEEAGKGETVQEMLIGGKEPKVAPGTVY